MVDLIRRGYIPRDKSYMIRAGFLDLINGYDDTPRILSSLNDLSDDEIALQQAFGDWTSGQKVRVKQSRTLYVFLQAASWKYNLNKEFIAEGALKKRIKNMSLEPSMLTLSLEKLLKLGGGTSQVASAAVLLGNEERVENAPPKLARSYEVREYYYKRRAEKKCWELRYDKTIERQAQAFLQYLKEGKMDISPEEIEEMGAESYCFLRAFGKMKRKEGKKRWPQLAGHESNRLNSMEGGILLSDFFGIIPSRDHRVIQSLLMRVKSKNKKNLVFFPEEVNKSWPQFPRFLNDAEMLAG